MKLHVNTVCMPSKKILNTLRAIQKYSFLKIADVDNVLKTCKLCMKIENFKKPRKAAPGITLARETTCQQVLYIDHKEILNKSRNKVIESNSDKDPEYIPKTKNTSILTVFEPVSQVTWIYPVNSYETETIKVGLRLYFQIHSAPKTVISDNAHSFTALKVWLKDVFGTELFTTSAYHPNANLSERPHLEFEKVLSIFNKSLETFKFENWEDNLAKAIMSWNSIRIGECRFTPFEIYKNRVQSEIEPVEFYSVVFEQIVKCNNLVKKKSGLKVLLPVYKRGQNVKVAFKDKPIRYGVVKSYKDNEHLPSIRVSFNGGKSIPVHKNDVCVPRSTVRDSPEVLNPEVNFGLEFEESNTPVENSDPMLHYTKSQ